MVNPNELMKQISCDQQPTILIGLGGFGSNITDEIYERVKEKFNVSAFSIDTDVCNSVGLINIPKQNVISIAQRYTVKEHFKYLPDAEEWFPNHSVLLHKTLSEGAGQIRALSRLAYELALKQRRFDKLLMEVDRLAKECKKHNCCLRVSVIATLVCGTASGVFLQVALLIREYLSKHYPALDVKIHGEFILPSTFLTLSNVPKIERRNLESNAYAAMKELNAINEHFFDNAPPIELKYGYSQNDDQKNFVNSLPYDYCFLYDRVSLGHNFSKLYIENTIIERLFSSSATDLNDVFEENLHLNIMQRAGNIYGTICTEKMSADSTILDSELFRSVINSTSIDKGKRIFLVCSPRRLNIDAALFSQNTIFIEKIDSSVSEISVTDFCFGIELCEMEKFKLKSGQYYTSYHSLINKPTVVITPHLNTNWHIELKNIGESGDNEDNMDKVLALLREIPKENFVFISYNSHDIETANQLKHILETNDVSCWMAPYSIPAGSDYGREIPKAIEKCKALLLILSEASQKSYWVPKEVGLAIGKGKYIVPFQIDNAPISEDFNFYLTNSQRITAYNCMTEAYKELFRRLKVVLV